MVFSFSFEKNQIVIGEQNTRQFNPVRFLITQHEISNADHWSLNVTAVRFNYIFAKQADGQGDQLAPFYTVLDATIDMILVPRLIYDIMGIDGNLVKCSEIDNVYSSIDIFVDDTVYSI